MLKLTLTWPFGRAFSVIGDADGIGDLWLLLNHVQSDCPKLGVFKMAVTNLNGQPVSVIDQDEASSLGTALSNGYTE